jgi:hypothetical protein
MADPGGQEPPHEAKASERTESTRAKKPYDIPQVRVLTDNTEIPDSFPGASALRRAGYRTYASIWTLPLEELAAWREAIGSDVVRAILALRPS